MLLLIAGVILLWGPKLVRADTIECNHPVPLSYESSFDFEDMDNFNRFPLAAAVVQENPAQKSDDELFKKYADEIKEAKRSMAKFLTTAQNNESLKQNYDLSKLEGAASYLLDSAESKSSNKNGRVNFSEMKHLMGRLGLGNVITRSAWTSTMMDIFNKENRSRNSDDKIMLLDHFRQGLIDVGFYLESGEKADSDVWNY